MPRLDERKRGKYPQQKQFDRMFRSLLITVVTLCLMAGCKFNGNDAPVNFVEMVVDIDLNQSLSADPDLVPSDPVLSVSESFEMYDHGPLEDFNFGQSGNYRRMTLDDCLASALQNSPTIRDLGGLILRAPDTITTNLDPAMAYVDPLFGEQAALSAFDAIFKGQLLFQKNDGLFNNQFIGDEGAFQQDLAEYKTGLSKMAANGASYGFNHVVNYELNNSPSNRFTQKPARTSFAYDTFLEAEVRQPLFQGAGVTFNRIAGPNNAPGIYNGVLIARASTDVALAEFETGVRDLISDVENAYWDLYFAYRDLEAKIEARNGAYDIWRNVEANKGEKSAAIIGQAKEQYYRFAADVEDAIHGRLNEGTRTNNGSSGGTFRRSGGVRTAERRLRLITGMTLNDNQLVVTADMPVDAASVFDWNQAKDNAIARRPELRRQRWKIKTRELELLASKNHLLPRIDLLAKYRARGFGRDLFGNGNELQQQAPPSTQVDSSAFATLFNNDLQEWEVGVDMSVPIGFRKQHAATRHAEMNLAREMSILKEQERYVVYGLSNAIGELARTSRVRKANLKRLEAAEQQFNAIQNIWREQDTTIDLVLEAQRRVIEAKLAYFQTQVEYMLAVKAIHFEEGTLFAYHNVALSESQADDLAEQQHLRRSQSNPRTLNYWIPGLHLSQETLVPTARSIPNAQLDAPDNSKGNPLMPIFSNSQPPQTTPTTEPASIPSQPVNSVATLISGGPSISDASDTVKKETGVGQLPQPSDAPRRLLTPQSQVEPATKLSQTTFNDLTLDTSSVPQDSMFIKDPLVGTKATNGALGN